MERFKIFLERWPVPYALLRATYNRLRALRAYRRRPHAIASYLSSHPIPKLQLGTGPGLLPGWLNTDFDPGLPDLIILDARARFPFADGTFHYVFSEHLIEHLTYREGLHMLRECHRVLAPGGRIRIATPSLERILALATRDKSEIQHKYIAFITDRYIPDRRLPDLGTYHASFVINYSFYGHGHRFLYDRETLQHALEQAGFTQITSYRPGESDDEELRGVESHGQAVGEEINQYETMVLEARRDADRNTLGRRARGSEAASHWRLRKHE